VNSSKSPTSYFLKSCAKSISISFCLGERTYAFRVGYLLIDFLSSFYLDFLRMATCLYYALVRPAAVDWTTWPNDTKLYLYYGSEYILYSYTYSGPFFDFYLSIL